MKFLLLLTVAAGAFAQSNLPPELDGIGIEQHLGRQLPMNAPFTDETGNPVTLGSLMHARPAVLAMVYYECPMLCSQILSGVVGGLRPLSLRVGRDFDVIAVSINPAETPAEAAAKKDFYAHRYSENGDAAGWHFLVGSQDSIRDLADAVGFRYRYDPRSKMFIHSSGIMVQTPDGKAARYLYGVEYQPKDLKLSLIEASNRKIGSRVDQILLFCYHYDPARGKYGAIAMNSLRISAVVVLALLIVGLGLLWRRDFRSGQVWKEAPHP